MLRQGHVVIRYRLISAVVLAFGVLFATAAADEAPALIFSVQQFAVDGDNPLDPVATTSALEPFLGEHTGMAGLLAARDALQRELRAGGYTFHRVVLPPQTLEGGTVRLEVLTFALGEVTVAGNEFFSEASIRASLPSLAAGGRPQLGGLSRDLVVANVHPAKSLKVNFRANEDDPDKLDARVQVSDSKPWSLFAGLNNIGNKRTGHTRMTVGGQYSNVTGHDDILTGSFTTSPDNADDVQQYGGFYQFPLYRLHGWITAFYIKSDVDVGNVQNIFDISGSGNFTGISYKRELLNIGRYKHSLTLGLQDRSFDTAISNTLTGLRINAFSTQVRSRPFSARYDVGYNWAATSLDAYVDFNYNLRFGGHNRADDYRAVRANADPSWKLWRFGLLATRRLPYELRGLVKLTAQYADQPLIPGEQLGVGGERSVRGFQERTISGDRGAVLNFELHSPPIRQLYGVRLLAFYDVGHKIIDSPLVGQRGNDTIASAGIGARWHYRNQVFAALDIGQPLAKAQGEASDSGTSKIHFNLEYRY